MNDFFFWNMRQPHPGPMQARMTDAECDELFTLFDDPHLLVHSMSAEMTDGYLTACVVGPEPVPVHEWMAAIFGQTTLPIPDDAAKRDRLLHLLLRRYADIQAAVRLNPAQWTEDKIFIPLTADVASEDLISPYQLYENGARQGDWECRDWAEGFRQAIVHEAQWGSLVANPACVDLLSPLMLYAIGYNPNQPDVQIEQVENLFPRLTTSVYDLYTYWHKPGQRLPFGRKPETPPLLRDTPKVGRNDPCPCGRGKKFKECCGA